MGGFKRSWSQVTASASGSLPSSRALAKPVRTASSPPKTRPVVIRSKASWGPTRRVSQVTPPQAGKIPIRRCTNWTCASGVRSRKSGTAVSSAAPPRARPSTRATVNIRSLENLTSVSCMRCAICRPSSLVPMALIVTRFPPELKKPPSPRRMTALPICHCSRRPTMSCSSSIISPDMQFLFSG
uniref:Uncharacterized protein n=1 Tax=Ixodes ricinus TaxID=34613 RepID=A0A6B0V1T3_IXORI